MQTLFLVLLSLTSLAVSTPFRGSGLIRKSSDLQSQAALEGSSTSGDYPLSDVETRSLDEIYRAALKEGGTLKVAWGGDVQASKNGISRAFTTRFPGISIDVNLDLSKYLDGGIDLEYEKSGGTSNGVDLAVIQAVHNFPRWKQEGRLLHYKVAPWDDIYPQFVDKDGAYTGLHIFTLGYQVYNPKTTSNTSLPKTYADYLLPEWKDKLIITYPNDDDAVLYLFKLITEKYGIDYIHSLQKNGVRWVRGTATPSILIGNTGAANKTDITMLSQNTQSISFASSSAFARGIATHDHDDVQMSWPQTGAIFSTTKMPETSKLFMSFIMDDQWQQIVSEGKFATRRKYDRANIMQQHGREPTNYVTFMSDRQKVEAWRFQVEKILGTPQGESPVDLW